jgi:hypothetical protein
MNTENKNIVLAPACKGKTVVCIAGGCSLRRIDVEACRGLFTIAINDSYKIAPFANILYACDVKWWEWHDGAVEFKGKKITHEYAKRHGVESIRPPYPGIDVLLSTGECGFDERPNCIRHGGNSGYQALHIAMHLGAKNIILLGYDMHNKSGKHHWFGQHPRPYHNSDNLRYKRWLECFETLVEPAKKRGQRIINCSPGSELTCFENMELEECLKKVTKDSI